MKRIFCVILILFLIISFTLPSFATATTVGTIALDTLAELILTAFGYVTTSTTVGSAGSLMIETLLQSTAFGAPSDPDTRAEIINDWKNLAVNGYINIASAPKWIKNGLLSFCNAYVEQHSLKGQKIETGTYTFSYYDPSTKTLKEKTVSISGIAYYFTYSYKSTYGNNIACAYLYGLPSEFISGYSTTAKLNNHDVRSIKFYGQQFPQSQTNEELNIALSYYPSLGKESIAEEKIYEALINNGVNADVAPFGGLAQAIIQHPNAEINIPDLNTVDLALSQNVDNETICHNLIADVIAGNIGYTDYIDTLSKDEAVSISVPNTIAGAIGETIAVTDTYAITDTGVGSLISSAVAVPSVAPVTAVGDYQLDLTDFFPFCIPFDIFDLFSCLVAAPVAPVIDFPIRLPNGSQYNFHVDLSPFNGVASWCRTLELLAFCVALALRTREQMIRS